MRMVKTQGLSAASIQACQERLRDLPACSPIRKEVSHDLQHYQDLEAEALSTVGVQDVTTWVSENVGDTMQSKRRSEFPRSQPPKPGAETAEPLADTG
jgi:hypothetical protein